jgi:hypothetical protein
MTSGSNAVFLCNRLYKQIIMLEFLALTLAYKAKIFFSAEYDIEAHSSLSHIHYTEALKRHAMYKHSRLFVLIVSDEEKGYQGTYSKNFIFFVTYRWAQ